MLGLEHVDSYILSNVFFFFLLYFLFLQGFVRRDPWIITIHKKNNNVFYLVLKDLRISLKETREENDHSVSSFISIGR